jgi:tetratricopeptide (TPR) repeat protein
VWFTSRPLSRPSVAMESSKGRWYASPQQGGRLDPFFPCCRAAERSARAPPTPFARASARPQRSESLADSDSAFQSGPVVGSRELSPAPEDSVILVPASSCLTKTKRCRMYEALPPTYRGIVRRVALVTLLVLGTLGAWAQPVTMSATHQQLLNRLTRDVTGWESLATQSLVLTIVAGILGLVIATLQGVSAKPMKAIVVALGLLVSSLILINNTVFSADHRAYQRVSHRARSLLNQIQNEVELFPDLKTDQDRDSARARIKALADQIEQTYDTVLAGDKQVALAPLRFEGFTRTAYASTLAFAVSRVKPEWTAKGLPADDTRVYFVGVASGESLDQAMTESRDSAIAAAAHDISVNLPESKGINREALAGFLTQGAQTIDKYSEYDPASKAYRVYTLIGILKNSIKTDALVFGLGRASQVPQGVVQAAIETKPAPVSYTIKRQVVYEQLRDAAKAKSDPRALALLEEGRLARKAGRTEPATSALKAAVDLQPDLYLGWYNLGLNYEFSGQKDLAEQAYRRALALAPHQSVQDPSLPNTMGWLLLRQGRFDEAQSLFKKALAIDPDHPKAARNLKAAEAHRLPG